MKQRLSGEDVKQLKYRVQFSLEKLKLRLIEWLTQKVERRLGRFPLPGEEKATLYRKEG